MKLVAHFDNFLADTVNLNDTRLDQLDTSFESIKTFLRASDYAPRIVSFYKHGSWAHKTIIRPVEGNAFDADVIVFVKPVDGWAAADYVNQLAAVFKDSELYKEKIRTYSHCVTIEYAGERKMDIAPCVVDREREETYEVCNRTNNEFQRTEPEKYTSWINDKNASSGANSFRKVTRLLKYLRDIKTTFTCPSFLLTTLLGMQVRDNDKDGSEFVDVPTALKTMVSRLDGWLQARTVVPAVFNPALPSEDQASGWTDVQYTNFRSQIHRYRQWVDDAFDESDADEAMQKWRRVFGDSFGLVRKAQAVTEATKSATPPDDVDVIRRRGLGALSPMVLTPDWRKTPSWRPAILQQNVSIRARLVTFDNGRTMPLESQRAVEPGQSVQFWALLNGINPGPQYRTQWRITNTGQVARRLGQLRGEFYDSTTAHSRREELSYRGVHMAEAFIIRISDDVLVGSSKPFYVVIE